MVGIKKRLFSGRAPSKSRDPWWDNIRYISGTLVVVGHTIEPLRNFDGPLWLYLATWALRLPVFVMVCGYFSTAGPLTAREIRRIVESIALPYLFFTAFQTVQIKWLTGEWKVALALPKWTLWFLFSLIIWRVLLPYIAALRFPLTLSIIASLAIGYFDEFGSAYSASRTVAFLPFFILGWKIKQGLFSQLLSTRWTRYAGAGLITGSAAIAWLVRDEVGLGWLSMSAPYGTQADAFGTLWAWTFRAGLLMWGFTLALCLINLVPRRNIPFVTYLGAGGMYIFLLHPLVLRPLREYGIFERVDSKHEQVFTVMAAILLAALLASPPVRRLARPVVQPNIPWLFSKKIRQDSQRKPVVEAVRIGAQRGPKDSDDNSSSETGRTASAR
ncbi:acyltransferase family protein [Streptomyces sp. ACA25]|uniref:acyltransferase family protein n=1 Tax=Streptomyces sp. ACA25 TaxID=3022596 RepID=UPI00230820A3|nr:acyltransferase family protein [Streptomyces sp. ACA25]MDB1086694.1 acyltransferase family protein [Streptomyces sp. ACA25]